LVLVTMLAACGRLGFGDGPPGGGDGGGVAQVGACASASAGTGPITVSAVSGSYNGQMLDQISYPMQAFDRSSDETNGSSIAVQPGAGSGTFSFTLVKPVATVLEIDLQDRANASATHEHVARAIDVDLALDPVTEPSVVWDFGQLSFLCTSHNNEGAACINAGIIGVGVRSCSGDPLSGVSVAIMPAMGSVLYSNCVLGGDCSPAYSGTATNDTGIVVGLDFPPGDYTITASAPGLTFDPFVLHRMPEPLPGYTYTNDQVLLYAR
jgi:hypothetical protein